MNLLSDYKKNPILYVLTILGCLLIVLLFLSLYIPPKEIEIINEVIVYKEIQIEKIIYKDRIEYKNVNVFISGMDINTVVQFYKENFPEEYEKILFFYDQYTKSRIVSKTIVEQSLRLKIPIHLALGLAERESGFDPLQETKNSNKSWDRGLFQLNSASRTKWKKADFFNIEKNTIEGLSCLKWLLEEFTSNDLAIAAYNAGYGNITKKVIPFTTAIHVFEIKNNEMKYNIAFSSILLLTLSNIEYNQGQFKLIH